MASTQAADNEPVLAIYATALAPYEAHLYGRFAKELPVTVKTFDASRDRTRDWQLEGLEAIGLEDLSEGRPVPRMASLADQRHAWSQGGRVIGRLKELDARYVIVNGYYDVGRIRTIAWCWWRGKTCFMRGDSNVADDRQNGPIKRTVKRVFIGAIGSLTRAALVTGPNGFAYWRQYGYGDDRMFCVPPEPDYALIESITADEAADAAARHGLDHERRRIVYSGRLAPVKRVDLLIDAFARLADERPEWDLLILGDGELRDDLEARVPDTLRERVIWTGFLADQRDVSRLYRASHVLALPSDREPWALVVNEACTAGLAVVTSDVVGAAPALVRSGVNGETFPRGDVDGLTEALRVSTEPKRNDDYRAASPGVVAEWRRDFDPVKGLREALGVGS